MFFLLKTVFTDLQKHIIIIKNAYKSRRVILKVLQRQNDTPLVHISGHAQKNRYTQAYTHTQKNPTGALEGNSGTLVCPF